ncbi:MAG: hypothetical protein ACRDPJ_07045 [Nocardioidaceae bacterium]
MTSDEEEAVRRLLAEAGEETPVMPPDIAARLDDVLAGLVADRTAPEDTPDETPEVTDLSTRRSRLWPKLLVAAAAVSVVGLGVGNVLGGGAGSDSESSMPAADRADAGAARQESAGEAAPAPSSPGRHDVDLSVAGRQLPRLRTGSLTVDAQRIVDFSLGTAQTNDDVDGRAAMRTTCAAPATRAGDDVVVVRLDGAPSVLVLRAPEHGERAAEVFPCHEPSTPVAETTVEDR